MSVDLSAVDPVVRRLTGRVPVAWDARDEGAYSDAGRWVVRFADGGTAFVKAEAEPDDQHGVAVEHHVLSNVSLPCLPALLAYGDGVLVTEDLSAARWGTPLTPDDVALLSAAMDLVAAVPAPAGLRPMWTRRGWAAFAEDPAPLLALGLVDEAWAARHVPALAEAEAGADVAGDRLLHTDLWLQNWCRADRGAVLVDWAGTRVGNPLLMRAWGEAGVRAAGGPSGLVLAGHPEWAAWVAGQAALFLGESPDDHPRLKETERRELAACLRWACDEVGLPHPEPGPAFRDLGPWRP